MTQHKKEFVYYIRELLNINEHNLTNMHIIACRYKCIYMHLMTKIILTAHLKLMNKVKNKSLKNKSLLYLKLSILIGEFLNLKNKILILNNLQPPKVMWTSLHLQYVD